MNDRPRGFFSRIHSLVSGVFSLWMRDREVSSPRAVYEQAIDERVRQYGQLKQAVAGILYMRNKLEGESRETRSELARAQDLIRRAVSRGDDDLALQLIEQKDVLIADLERDQRELGEIANEVEVAKANLIKFRGEIKALERERVRIMAQLANARARRRFQQAIEGLSVESDMKALENVREHVERLRAEGSIERELGDDTLRTRVRAIREEARTDAARRELVEIKRRMRPEVIAAQPEPVVEVHAS